MVAFPEEESNVMFLGRTKTESILLAVGDAPMPICGRKWHQTTAERVLAPAGLSRRVSLCSAPHPTDGCAYKTVKPN